LLIALSWVITPHWIYQHPKLVIFTLTIHFNFKPIPSLHSSCFQHEYCEYFRHEYLTLHLLLLQYLSLPELPQQLILHIATRIFPAKSHSLRIGITTPNLLLPLTSTIILHFPTLPTPPSTTTTTTVIIQLTLVTLIPILTFPNISTQTHLVN